MSAETHDSPSRNQRVDEVIAAYLEAVDSGSTPDPNEIIAEHPDIGDELASYFADCDQFEGLVEPLQAATRPPKPNPLIAAAAIGPRDRSFADYELLEEIARGGMGVVYKARQISLNRIVALKMVLAGRLASPEDVQRFRAEAEAAANLDHAGIVAIYEIGEHLGQHYFTMGYVDGQSLADRLREGPLESRAAATLLKQVCDAVHYAHEHDVVHRDLKPANILLQEQSSEAEKGVAVADASPWKPELPAASPQPRITDFGLAKRSKHDSGLTAPGQIMGTPSYMSPEQASGATHEVGRPSDIYSLGAILYQLLTGRPPFQAETPLETLAQLLDSDPLPPRLLNRNVPRELEAVCMKCLEKEPSRRYASARELGDDMQRYLEGEAIHASGVNLRDRVTRVLQHSRHEEHFRGWGSGLIAFGVVILLSHLAIFGAERIWLGSGALDPWAAYFLPRSVMFAALLIMLWRFRHYSVLPTNSAERLVWVVWIGYLLALGAINSARMVFGHDHGEVYAFSAALAGFGFLIMGGHVWGGGYVVGLVFMIAAPVLAIYLDHAAVAYGALWAGALTTFGLHYWRLGRAARRAGNL